MSGKFVAPIIETKFYCPEHKQKLLLNVLLQYSLADLTHLAMVLDISEEKLKCVLLSKDILSMDQGKALATLFLIFFGG